jgi:segregation and condensation protein A
MNGQPTLEKHDQSPIIAIVAGEPFTAIPHDLFIPPDALEVLLDSFTGPLDLLLYLIRRQNIDIMDIPIVLITRQYMQYIDLMELRRMELAADYLVMAAMLAEIKSRLLLPREPTSEDMPEEDPRMELVRRLQAYEQFKHAAQMMDELVRCERDVFPVRTSIAALTMTKPQPEVALSALVKAMASLLLDNERGISHPVQRELLSVRDRMSTVLARLQTDNYFEFHSLYVRQEGRMGLVVSLLAILELAKESLLVIMQTSEYAPIYIKGNTNGSAVS